MSVQSELNAFGATQVLVYLKKPIADAAAASAAANPVAEVTRHFAHTAASRFGALAAAEGVSHGGPAYRVYKNLGIVLGSVDEASYKAVKESDAVRAVAAVPEISLIRPTSSALAAPKAGPTWGIKRLGVPALWKEGLTGKGVLIAHLDTGVDADHPVLKGAVAAFAEFDSFGREVAGAKPSDSDSHGTHTAATIAGRHNKKADVGVAPGASLASAMVIEGGNVIARILGGMDWAVGQGVKILSMSLGLRGFRQEFLALMQIIRAQGILPVIASGNEGAGTSRSPGNYDLCLSVGAFDSQDQVADFSSSQRFSRPLDPFVPDLVGPGVATLSAMPGRKFGKMDGTSMATPHIAGLAALLWEAKPNATVDEIERVIFDSCRRPATMPQPRANRGVPDAVEAHRLLTTGAVAGPPKPKKKPKKKKKKPKKKPGG
jgi:subtilisin family serine protease